MYQNEIREMSEVELLELLSSNGWSVENPEYVDADEVIEIMQLEQGTVFESAEDDILDTIMNGNWTQAVEQMLENYITPHGLVDYVNDYRFEEFEDAYRFFNLESAVSITELYSQMRREVA